MKRKAVISADEVEDDRSKSKLHSEMAGSPYISFRFHKKRII